MRQTQQRSIHLPACFHVACYELLPRGRKTSGGVDASTNSTEPDAYSDAGVIPDTGRSDAGQMDAAEPTRELDDIIAELLQQQESPPTALDPAPLVR